jgi:hypothetical protein
VQAAAVDICERVVVTITAQTKADDLALIQAIIDRAQEQGRPVPNIYLSLQNQVLKRTAPTAACKP